MESFKGPFRVLHFVLGVNDTAWKLSKYGPEITPYLDTFHAVETSCKR